MEVAPERLVDQPLAADLADALQFDQLVDPGRPAVRGGRLALRLHLALDLGDLFGDQLQADVLAHDLGHQPGRQGAAVAGARPRQLLVEVLAPRLDIAHPLAVQQPFDPVAVSGALVDQPLPLARQPPGVLLLGRRRTHHAAHPRLAAVVADQHPHQPLEIEPVGLGLPRTPRHLDARRIENPVLDPLIGKPAVQPEAVKTRLVAAHHTHRPAQLLLRLCPLLRDQLPHRRRIPARHQVPAQLALAAQHHPDQPLRFAQFKRNIQSAILGAGGGGVDVMRRLHDFLRRLVLANSKPTSRPLVAT